MNLERNIPANRQMMTIPRDRSAAIYNNVPVAKPPLSFTRCLNVRYRDYGIPISTRQGYFEFELKRKKHGTLHGSRGPENFPRVKAETRSKLRVEGFLSLHGQLTRSRVKMEMTGRRNRLTTNIGRHVRHDAVDSARLALSLDPTSPSSSPQAKYMEWSRLGA